MKNNKTRGILYIVLSSACFATMSVFVRLAGDLPTTEKALYRNVIALAVSAWMMHKERIELKIPKGCGGFIFFRSFFGTVSLICNFYAISNINLADANMLQKLAPFFNIVFSFLILKETITKKQIFLIIGAFLGSLLIIKPTMSNIVLIPYMIASIGGLSMGLSHCCLRGCTIHGAPKTLIIFIFSVFSTLVLLPFNFVNFVMPSFKQLAYLLICGIFSAAGQFAITNAYANSSAREISVFDYSQVIFSAILGFIIFNQQPDIYSIFGYIIITIMALANSSHIVTKRNHI